MRKKIFKGVIILGGSVEYKDTKISFDTKNCMHITFDTHEYVALRIIHCDDGYMHHVKIKTFTSKNKLKPSKDIINELIIYNAETFRVHINDNIITVSILDTAFNTINLIKINLEERSLQYCTGEKVEY